VELMMLSPVAVCDACVLYPAPLRSLLIQLSRAGLFKARWTNTIHEEWMRSIVREYPDINRRKAERVRELMNAAIPDSLVTGYEDLIDSLSLPDLNDRHVHAAAIRERSTLIITFNLRDFPAAELSRFNVMALGPDEFLAALLDQDPTSFCSAARGQREELRNPPKSVDEVLATFHKQGLVETVARLRPFSDLL